MITVLVADDHPVVREGLLAMLGTYRDIRVVGEAVDGKHAVDLAAMLKPDVVLMDLDMPVLDGAESIRALRQANGEIRVLVLTAYDTDERILDALQAGARGYLLKGVPRDELYRAIRVVHSGGSLLQPDIASKFISQVGKMMEPANHEEQLTAREQEVLQALARGLRNKEIARELTISERTVKFHVGVIFQKLGVGSRTEAMAEAAKRRLIRIS